MDEREELEPSGNPPDGLLYQNPPRTNNPMKTTNGTDPLAYRKMLQGRRNVAARNVGMV